MSRIRWGFVRSDDTVFTIEDPTFKLLEEELTTEVDFIPRSSQPGDDVPGISRDTGKDLTFEYETFGTESEFREYINTLLMEVKQAVKLRDTDNDTETNIKFISNTLGYVTGGFKLGAINTLLLRMTTPYWEDKEATTVTTTNKTSHSFVINNTGYIDTPFIARITALEAINQFSIIREEDNFGIVIKDLLFGTLGLTEFEVNMGTGNIILAENNRNESIVLGTGWFKLKPGTNTINFELSGAADLEIEYRKRYYI